jgi:hypothetical protein
MSNCFKHVFEPRDPRDPESPLESSWLICYDQLSCRLDCELEGLDFLRQILNSDAGTKDWSCEHHLDVRKVCLSAPAIFSSPDRTRPLSKAKLAQLTASLNAQAKTAHGEEYGKLQQQLIAVRQYKNLKRTFSNEGTLLRDSARKAIDRALAGIRKESPDLADYFARTIKREGLFWFSVDTEAVWDVAGSVLMFDDEIELSPHEILAHWIQEASQPLREAIARSLGRRLLKRTGTSLDEIRSDVEETNSRIEKTPVDASLEQ